MTTTLGEDLTQGGGRRTRVVVERIGICQAFTSSRDERKERRGIGRAVPAMISSRKLR